MKKILYIFLLIFTNIYLTNCTKEKVQDQINEPIVIESISTEMNEIIMGFGETKNLVIQIIPENATDKVLIYESSSIDIATVDNTGKITAIAEGTVNITVSSSNGKTTVVKVTVTKPVEIERLEAVEKEISLEIGSYKSIQMNILPNNATNKTLKYESSNELIATVDNTGKVTAKAEGVADITVSSSNGKTAVVKITVTKPLENEVIATVNGLRLTVCIKNLNENLEKLYVNTGDGNSNWIYNLSSFSSFNYGYGKATSYNVVIISYYKDKTIKTQKIRATIPQVEITEKAFIFSDTDLYKNQQGELILSGKNLPTNISAFEVEIDHAWARSNGLSFGDINSDMTFLNPLNGALTIVSRPYAGRLKISVAGIKKGTNLNEELIKIKCKSTSAQNAWINITSIKMLDENLNELKDIKAVNGLIRVTEEGN